ncbi:prepilin-type N-terminal cleavage/methylation domain-containing protein [bacterium]|nr:prepilin-type N-terminal cleavage/methylation domain-containing protein [bacterium]
MKKGFTLIELLVVIAIIAILAAILFPVFTSAKQTANRASCLSNIGQVGKSIQAYASDNSGRIPKWYDGTHTWDKAIWDYLKNKKVLTCPVNKKPGYEYVRSYAMPKNISGEAVEQAPKISATVLLFEKGSRVIFEMGDSCGEWFSQTTGADLDPSNKYWHNGGKTFAFCDGHAAFFKYPGGPFSYNYENNFTAWSGNYVHNPGYGSPGYCGFADSTGAGDVGSVTGANLPR